MEALSNYTGCLGNFEVKLERTDAQINIEVENMINSKVHSLKLTNDLLPELAKTLFDDLNGFSEALIAGLKKSNPNINLSIAEISGDTRITVEYKTVIINKEKHFTFSLPLEGKEISDSERSERSQARLMRKVLELEAKLKQKNGLANSVEFKEIHPTFDPASRNASQFTFSNQNKTIISNAQNTWISLFAKDALPLNERSRFSFKIEKSSRPTMDFYFGIATANHKTDTQSCTNGVGASVLCSTNNYVYTNGSGCQGTAILVTHPGDTVSVLVDLKEGRIYFEIDGVIVFRGKIDNSLLNNCLYPCVNVAYSTDSVSFI